MGKIPRQGDYLTSADVKDGDILEILEGPELRSKEDTGFDRDVYGVTVLLPNKTNKMWTLNKTTYNDCWDEWGDESENWIGKKLKIATENRKIRGEKKTIIYGEPTQENSQPQQDKLMSNQQFTERLEKLGIDVEAFNKLDKQDQTRLLKKLAMQ